MVTDSKVQAGLGPFTLSKERKWQGCGQTHGVIFAANFGEAVTACIVQTKAGRAVPIRNAEYGTSSINSIWNREVEVIEDAWKQCRTNSTAKIEGGWGDVWRLVLHPALTKKSRQLLEGSPKESKLAIDGTEVRRTDWR